MAAVVQVQTAPLATTLCLAPLLPQVVDTVVWAEVLTRREAMAVLVVEVARHPLVAQETLQTHRPAKAATAVRPLALVRRIMDLVVGVARLLQAARGLQRQAVMVVLERHLLSLALQRLTPEEEAVLFITEAHREQAALVAGEMLVIMLTVLLALQILVVGAVLADLPHQAFQIVQAVQAAPVS